MVIFNYLFSLQGTHCKSNNKKLVVVSKENEDHMNFHDETIYIFSSDRSYGILYSSKTNAYFKDIKDLRDA